MTLEGENCIMRRKVDAFRSEARCCRTPKSFPLKAGLINHYEGSENLRASSSNRYVHIKALPISVILHCIDGYLGISQK